MRTTSELPRILAVSLLWCGVLVIALYTGVAIVVGLFSDSEALGRFSGVIYLSGLFGSADRVGPRRCRWWATHESTEEASAVGLCSWLA